MPTYLTPGVYVEEVQSGARPIEGVGTAVAAFVGFAESGPFHEPTLVTNWDQYVPALRRLHRGHLPAPRGLRLLRQRRWRRVRRARRRVRRAPPHRPPAPRPGARPGRSLAASWSPALPGAGTDVSVEIADADGENPPEDRFKLLVRQGGKVVETYEVSARKNVKGYLVTQVPRARS